MQFPIIAPSLAGGWARRPSFLLSSPCICMLWADTVRNCVVLGAKALVSLKKREAMAVRMKTFPDKRSLLELTEASAFWNVVTIMKGERGLRDCEMFLSSKLHSLFLYAAGSQWWQEEKEGKGLNLGQPTTSRGHEPSCRRMSSGHLERKEDVSGFNACKTKCICFVFH